MTKNAPLAWRFGIASLSLLAAVAVYCFTRIYPPEILVPFQSIDSSLVTHTEVFGSAPSFFYTLALGLFIGACAPTLANAKVHCMAWVGLTLCLEISQQPIFAQNIACWLMNNCPEVIGHLLIPFWSRGVFDLLDLFATLMGGAIAIFLLAHSSSERGIISV